MSYCYDYKKDPIYARIAAAFGDRVSVETESIDGARAARMSKADRFAAALAPTIDEIKAAGVSTLSGIAGCLTARGVRTSRGGQEWTAKQVSRVLARL